MRIVTIVLFVLICVPCVQGQSPFTLTLTDAMGPSGTPVDIELLLDASAGVIGWSWGVCHDNTAVNLGEVAQGTTTMTANNGGPVDFYSLNIVPGEGWYLGAVVNLLGNASIPPGTGYQMNVITYDLIGPDGTVTEVVFCDNLGMPPVSTIIVQTGGLNLIPQQNNSTITIGSPVVPDEFIRGDADGDAIFNGIVDASYILAHQFNGGPPPPCFEAADADGNGDFNGLVDGLHVLAHQFQGGPPPPAPYPDCGEDPDPMTSLGCNVLPPCP